MLEPFGDEDVLELSIPYGIKLINEGEFAWSELGEYQDWADRYGVPIPVSLVTDKVVELYDIALPAPYSWDGKPFIRRAVPLYLIQPGEFFGLFESFAPVGPTGLRGTAGGTTLVSLPPLGDRSAIDKFAKNLGRKFKPDDLKNIADNLTAYKDSRMTVGPFFREMLCQIGCPWRCQMLLLSPEFVAKLQQPGDANTAFVKMTNRHLAVTVTRLVQTANILQEPPLNGTSTSARVEEIQPVRMIVDRCRPGFAPVFETHRDELILPAKALHDLVLGEQGSANGESQSHITGRDRDRDGEALSHSLVSGEFPLLFRPSLPGENCFYFLSRAYVFNTKRDTTTAKDRLDVIVRALNQDRAGELAVFWEASREALTQRLKTYECGSGRPIAIEAHRMVEGGIIGIDFRHGEDVKSR